MNKITQNNQNGFTLIEVMTAIAIFAIGILGVAKMQLLAIEGNSNANNSTKASTLAQEKAEKLMMLDYDDLNDTNNDGTPGLSETYTDLNNNGKYDSGVDTPTADYLPETYGIYTIFWNIATNEPVTDAKKMRIYVVWRQNGVEKQMILNLVKVVI